MGGFITGLIGIIIMPWKLLATPEAFILEWLVGSSSLIGALSGLMICDYFLLRKTVLSIPELYNPHGIYGSWNVAAFVCFFIAVAPNLPGFIALFLPEIKSFIPGFIISIYDYAWFVSTSLGILSYYLWGRFISHEFTETTLYNNRPADEGTPLMEVHKSPKQHRGLPTTNYPKSYLNGD